MTRPLYLVCALLLLACSAPLEAPTRDAAAWGDAMSSRDAATTSDAARDADVARDADAFEPSDSGRSDSGASDLYRPGESYLSETGFIEYIPGDSPILVVAAHGGHLAPSEVATRTWGVTVNDAHTQELSRELVAAIYAQTGLRAHLVVNLLRRAKLDANREIDEAAQGDPLAEAAWHEFHELIDHGKAAAIHTFGYALLFDMHGQAARPHIELGYLLTASDLRRTDDALNDPRYVDKSSIRSLARRTAGRHPFASLVRGRSSMGTLLEARGYAALPSDVRAAPDEGAGFFNGGYNTVRHGSRDGGEVSAMQIEVNRTLRFDPALRTAFASDLAAAVMAFMHEHFEPL